MALILNDSKEERRRCAEIVADERRRIERQLPSIVPIQHARAAMRMIQILKNIESKIIRQPNSKKESYSSDFSLDDMQIAEAIIEEQSTNPFDVEG